MVERIRFLTDLKTLANHVKCKGSVIVSATNSKLFVEHVRAITSSLDEISDEELREGYRRFLIKIEKYINQEDMQNISSMSILKDFFKTELK